MRLIFTACSGRTGTAYLASLLTLVPGLYVAHERPPALAKKSNEQCKQSLRNALKYMLSKETDSFALISHAFLKTCPEWWLEHHPETDIIVLTRPARQIALSSWRRFSVPHRTKLGRTTEISPYTEGNRYPIRKPEELTDYSLCYWHALEIEARQKEVEHLYKGAGRTVHTLSMAELVDWRGEHFHGLLSALNLPEPEYDHYRTIAKCKINAMSAASPMCRALPPNIQNFELAVKGRRLEREA